MEAAQLAQVEALCEALYTGIPAKLDTGEVSRNEAQQRLLSLQSNAEYIPQCQYILDHSASQYACLVASNSLIELVTAHWNSFTAAQRVDIRNYVLAYLANKGPQLQNFLVLSLIKLVCRITRLGWFDGSAHRELTDEVTKFLQATVDHCILGLRILNQLVDELNIPTSGRALTHHRKTSVSLRDISLLTVFQLGLTTLRQIQTGAISKFECITTQITILTAPFSPILQPPSNGRKLFWESKPFRLQCDVSTSISSEPILTNPLKMSELSKLQPHGAHSFLTRALPSFSSISMPTLSLRSRPRLWKV